MQITLLRFRIDTDLVKLYKSAEKDLITYTNKINRIKRELSTSAFGSIQTKMTSLSKDVDKVKEAVIKGIADFKKAGKLESVNEARNKTITAIGSIIGKKQAKKIDGVLVDMQTANVIMKVWNALNPSNRKKFEKLSVQKMANVAWKLVK